MPKDTSVKRGVPSPRVPSLRECLDLPPAKGTSYGAPITPETVQENLRTTGNSGKGAKRGGTSGLKTKAGYDVKTKVHITTKKK